MMPTESPPTRKAFPFSIFDTEQSWKLIQKKNYGVLFPEFEFSWEVSGERLLNLL